MRTRTPDPNEEQNILALVEDHFNDLKSVRIKPATLQKAFVSFANSDGGDLYVGVEDPATDGERIVGYETIEQANDVIHVLLEETNPSIENVELEFIDFSERGYILHISIPKSTKVHYTARGECFIRVNARKKRIQGERITQLSYMKGVFQYEKQPVEHLELDDILQSPYLSSYIKRVKSRLAPEEFLRKQRLLSKVNNGQRYPNVGCILLFDEEPQASLDTRCAIKLYRLRTTEAEYRREQLESMPNTLTGPIEQQIITLIKQLDDMLTGATYREGDNLVKLAYPAEAIKEIIVNAVIHRDYSLNDDIHVRVYDNRIEVQSPGKLPGYITVNNIYDERYSRNPNIVRMLHNLPDPLNHDIGEGLNTARNELRKAGLVPPAIEELENAVLVTIKHQRLASLEDVIIDYLNEHPDELITNRMVRELSGEEDVNRVKSALQRLRRQGKIEPEDPNARAFDFRYRLITD